METRGPATRKQSHRATTPKTAGNGSANEAGTHASPRNDAPRPALKSTVIPPIAPPWPEFQVVFPYFYPRHSLEEKSNLIYLHKLGEFLLTIAPDGKLRNFTQKFPLPPHLPIQIPWRSLRKNREVHEPQHTFMVFLPLRHHRKLRHQPG
jgi:hypothetical protein